MDAHVFRRLCDALAPLLSGARLEKIQSPAPGVHAFTFYARRRKEHLFLRADRRTPFLFLSPERQSTGRHPDAPVMRLRKHLAGRRVAACLPDWPARRLSLLFRGGSEYPESAPPETWLVLDLREGPRLLLGASPDMPVEPLWPEPEELAEACADENWRNWPVLTPALRRTLPHLEPLEQQALVELHGPFQIRTQFLEGGVEQPQLEPIARLRVEHQIMKATPDGFKLLECLGM